MAKNFMFSEVVRSTYNMFYVLSGDPIVKSVPITYDTESGYDGVDGTATGVDIEYSASKTGWEPARVTHSTIKGVSAC